ncbi:MAG: hypothetical protein RJB01_1618 [Actinomycetota bacterium]|jgi:metallophosphoesterase (TIGR03767 family)
METTLTSRIVQGQANDLGWRELELGPGEPHAHVVPAGEVLGCIWHLSDLHLCDAESPVRIEYLDRLADPDSPVREEIGEVGTYRPQEILTVHVATAMVNTANALSQGPVTRAPVNAMLITGDVTDNAQSNELDWYTTVINGGQITPASGGEHSSWCGVSDAETWDEHYWHPDGPPTGMPPDRPTRLYGFPRIPGLIEAARQPVTSPGVMYPIMSVHGNHDALLQGTVAPDAGLRDYAIGGEAITGLSEGFDPRNIIAAVAPNGPARYLEDPDAPRRMITADAERRLVRPGEFATAAGRDVNYWVQDFGRLRFICLDTVNPYGGWQGSLDEIQFLWLRAQLEAATEKYVVIASHHPSPTMTNDYAPDGQQRILGSQVVALLLDYPNVIAWIAGHVHFNAAIHHQPGHDDVDSDEGFWEITTSSLIDWPQQGRIFEFIAVEDRVAIVSTVVDHASPQGWSPGEPLDVSSMAGISRLLAVNDYQRRDPTPLNELRAGSPEVRNAVWWSRVH